MTHRHHLRPSGRVIVGGLAVVMASIIGVVLVSLSHNQHRKDNHPRSSDAGRVTALASSLHVCGSKEIHGGGPASAPRGAIRIPAGNDSDVDWGRPRTTYWFAPGTHTLGGGQYTQIIPGAGSTYIGAPGAVLDGQHENFYAFGGNAANVRIGYLTIQDFGTKGGNRDEGVVNHDSAPGWTIDHSTLKDNAGAGTMLGSRNMLSYDCLSNNQQYGFNAYSPTGPVHLVIQHSEIVGNDTYNWEKHQPGCGCTGGGKFWAVRGAVIKDNWVHGNHSVGLWADTNNRGFDIEGNYIQDNYNYGLIYEISYNAIIKGNTFVRNGLGAGPLNRGFPTGAIYISESGSDSRVPGPYGGSFLISQNTFVNNWGGVILWENSNRFCGSPANTSSGACTLVSPATVTAHTCDAHVIARAPYYSACRWKTQNVKVNYNTFDFDPAAIGPACTINNQCGFQGIFSEYGTYPSWSPYKGTSIENHITFDQGNRFAHNRYNGPWRFMIHEEGDVMSWQEWQAGPYEQDADSVMSLTTVKP